MMKESTAKKRGDGVRSRGACDRALFATQEVTEREGGLLSSEKLSNSFLVLFRPEPMSWLRRQAHALRLDHAQEMCSELSSHRRQ